MKKRIMCLGLIMGFGYASPVFASVYIQNLTENTGETSFRELNTAFVNAIHCTEMPSEAKALPSSEGAGGSNPALKKAKSAVAAH